jgi:uncharacterized membrane protein YjjP (DUF1212 family)
MAGIVVDGHGFLPCFRAMSAATSPFRQRCNFIIDLARRLHACGMSTDRLEGAVLTVSKRLGVRTEIWCNPTGIILSFSSPQKSDGAEITRVLRLAPGDINLKALAMVDDIAERVTDGRMEVDEGLQALTALDRPMGREKLAITVLAFGLASGSVAALLRTSWADVAASAVIGLMIGLLSVASSNRPRLHEASDAIAALLATLTASAIAAFLTPLSLQTVVIASLIVLMPGLMLTTAVAELSSQNWASGTARFAGATVALLKLTFGTVVASFLGRCARCSCTPTTRCGEGGFFTRLDKLLLEVEAQLEQKGVALHVEDDARGWIAKRGYDPKMGARPMARVIQEHIKRPLAEELLFGRLEKGGHAFVSLGGNGELKVEVRSAEEPALLE